jgi:molecular chaperone GrpE
MENKQTATAESEPVEDLNRAAETPTQASEEPSYEGLRLMLEDMRAKADEHLEQLLRSRAEMENLLRRSEREVDKARKFALDSFFQELLPVKDSLELGLSAAQDPSANVEKLREGMELTDRMLAAAMAKFGAREINPLNEPFNPELHQAMSMQESAAHAPNTVMMVFQRGYLLNERLIRPARVIVAKAPSRGSESDTGSRVNEKA